MLGKKVLKCLVKNAKMEKYSIFHIFVLKCPSILARMQLKVVSSFHSNFSMKTILMKQTHQLYYHNFLMLQEFHSFQLKRKAVPVVSCHTWRYAQPQLHVFKIKSCLLFSIHQSSVESCYFISRE